MVKLNKIYTRTGDAGTSGLVDGSRRSKDDVRFAACGSVDEANAAIGLVLCCQKCGQDKERALEGDLPIATFDLTGLLQHIQNDLFDLGADLATPYQQAEKPGEALRIVAAQIDWLERQIDHLNAFLTPLRSFILPGGSAHASYLHLARTIVRRAERDMVALGRVEKINPHALCYINRLSDLLFVAARWANNSDAGDILWVPGQNRQE